VINVTFVCGHSKQSDGTESTLVCPTCGESGVQLVAAPMPTFRGHVRGPHAQFEALSAKAVTFEEKKDA
jgi:hypothetical protein